MPKTALIVGELAPQNIHVAHFVIDGSIRSHARPDSGENPDSTLEERRDRTDLPQYSSPTSECVDLGS